MFANPPVALSVVAMPVIKVVILSVRLAAVALILDRKRVFPPHAVDDGAIATPEVVAPLTLAYLW